MVCLDGLRAAVRTAPPRPRAHPIRQSDLRHDPPQAPQDRCAGAYQRAADQIRDGFGLPLSARLHPRPCPTNQRRGALTKQNKQATIFRPVNRSTITVPAKTRIGCGPSSLQSPRAIARLPFNSSSPYEKSGLTSSSSAIRPKERVTPPPPQGAEPRQSDG